jgi:uncharacterized membrane protein (DUF485 family)
MSDNARASASSPQSSAAGETEFERVQRSDSFQHLRRRHRSFVFPVAIAFLVWYFAYVLLADYAHDFMATPVLGNINIGLLLGLGQFVTTFAITTWYVSYANRRLDPLASELRGQLEAGERDSVGAADGRPAAVRIAGQTPAEQAPLDGSAPRLDQDGPR